MADSNSPIFIIGNPRSGTTLLRLMLTAHSEIVIAPESGFAVWYYPKYKDWEGPGDYAPFIEDLFQATKIENWNLDREVYTQYLEKIQPTNYSQLVSSVYTFFAKKIKSTCSVWGDKNNSYLDKIPTIHTMYPNARYIHIIRDGRSVACSYKKLAQKRIEGKYAPNLPSEIPDIANSWRNNIQIIEKDLSAIEQKNHMVLRFEDLVVNSEVELRRICDFIQLPYDPNMMNYYQLTADEGKETHMAWKSKNNQPVIAEEASRYLKELTSKEIQQFNDIANDALNRYQYL